jgi:DNA-binding NarL/FixJ family response regulator
VAADAGTQDDRRVSAATPEGGDERGAIRVLIAEDHVLLREGLARLLIDAGLEVAGQVGDADGLLRKVAIRQPDVVITDVVMPPGEADAGLRAAIEIRRRWPGVGVLVLSQYLEEGYALALVGDDAQGVGYLLKDRVGDVDSFGEAVRRVAEGGSVLDPAVVTQMVGRRRRAGPLDDLTERERTVLELMAEGRSNRGIAEALTVSPAAVEKHVTGIFGKLGLAPEPSEHRRVLAVLTFLRA